MDDYEPTQAGRAVEDFVDEHLSNWYVRLCRRRFWKGEYEHDKICAYQTLYECLETIVRLIAPISPFFSDFLFQNLNLVTKRFNVESVHHVDFPELDGSQSPPSSGRRRLTEGTAGGRGAEIEIRIIDNGIGIPQKILDKIFQPFFTTKPTGQGTGLGLSLSYDIIKVHGGEITVNSTEGGGAEFIVLLPILPG